MRVPHQYVVGLGRKAIAGVLATIIVLAAVFAIGVGFMVYQSQTTLSATLANNNRESSIQQASLEKLSLSPSLSGSTLTVGVTNRGGVSTTIVDAFVSNSNGVLQSPGMISNPCPQATLNIGSAGSCPLSGYTYTTGSVFLSVVTARGNTFTVEYPPTTSTSTVTVTTSTVSTSALPYVGIGSNALVIDMVASPPVAFTCTGCVTDTVTLYNYQSSGPLTNVALNPNPPTYTLCTGNVPGCTATLIPPTACSGPYYSNGAPDSNDSIHAYSGSGVAYSIYYVCTYGANTGVVGGFATFSGQANAMLGSTPIASALATSNAIKIGGSANVLNQGPFSANFFFFHYSACTSTNTPCTTNPGFSASPSGSDLPTGTLPNGYIISGNSYYVAYYIQVTNNFNTTIPILQYTFFQTDSTLGSDADFFIVGPASNSTFYSLPTNANSPTPAYYPFYTSSSSTPSLQQYTGSASACNPKHGGTITNCIDVNPGKTVTLTLAACNYGSNSWDWYSEANGANHGGGSISCTINGATTNSPDYTPPEATWLGIVVFFVYNGQVLAQMIPFAGDLICDSNC